MDPNDPKAVRIEWLDSIALKDRVWFRPETLDDAIKEIEASPMISVGYLVRESEHFIALAMSLHADDDEVIEFGGLKLIPVAAITNRQELIVEAAKHGNRTKRP